MTAFDKIHIQRCCRCLIQMICFILSVFASQYIGVWLTYKFAMFNPASLFIDLLTPVVVATSYVYACNMYNQYAKRKLILWTAISLLVFTTGSVASLYAYTIPFIFRSSSNNMPLWRLNTEEVAYIVAGIIEWTLFAIANKIGYAISKHKTSEH